MEIIIFVALALLLMVKETILKKNFLKILKNPQMKISRIKNLPSNFVSKESKTCSGVFIHFRYDRALELKFDA